MHISIPSFADLTPTTLVLDYNGTIAQDGELIPGVAERMVQLSEMLQIVVLTADTHGTCAAKLKGLPVTVVIIGPGSEAQAKRDYVRNQGADACIAVGNGRNDGLMLAEAGVGIAVMQAEGAAGAALTSADVVVTSILDALDLILKPARLKATLRT